MKNCLNSLSRSRYQKNVVPGASKFFSRRREPRRCADSFDRLRSRVRSLRSGCVKVTLHGPKLSSMLPSFATRPAYRIKKPFTRGNVLLVTLPSCQPYDSNSFLNNSLSIEAIQIMKPPLERAAKILSD